MLRYPIIAALITALTPEPVAAQQTEPTTQRFASRSNVFQVDLPADWRQMAPVEITELLKTTSTLPVDLTRNEPSMFYTVGPIDRWREGSFDGRYLYVVEQQNEWVTGDDIERRLREMWDDKGRSDSIRYVLTDIKEVSIGQDDHQAISYIRHSQPSGGGHEQTSIDIHVPSGGRQISLSFTSWSRDFTDHEPEFRHMIASLTFSRRPRGEPSLGQRLWPPLVTGAIVGLALVLLYRRTRRVD